MEPSASLRFLCSQLSTTKWYKMSCYWVCLSLRKRASNVIYQDGTSYGLLCIKRAAVIVSRLAVWGKMKRRKSVMTQEVTRVPKLGRCLLRESHNEERKSSPGNCSSHCDMFPSKNNTVLHRLPVCRNIETKRILAAISSFNKHLLKSANCFPQGGEKERRKKRQLTMVLNFF